MKMVVRRPYLIVCVHAVVCRFPDGYLSQSISGHQKTVLLIRAHAENALVRFIASVEVSYANEQV